MFGPPITKAERFFRLERPFTEKELKSIYKKACFRWHPDRNGGSEESKRRLQHINDAKDELMRLLAKHYGILYPPKREYSHTEERKTSSHGHEHKKKESSSNSQRKSPPSSLFPFEDFRAKKGCLWHGKRWEVKPSLPKGWFYAANSQKHSKQVWTKLSGSPEVLIQQLEQFWRKKGLLV